MKKLLTTILIILLFPCISFGITEVDEDIKLYEPVEIKDGITLDIVKCIGLAFQNSPKIRRAMYELNIAKSEVGIAKSQYFPIFGAGVGFNYERNSNSIYYDKKYRDLPSVRIQASKLIWNFGKTTSYIKMQEFYKIAAEYEFMDSLCETLFDVKEKYYTLLKMKALLNIASNNVKLNEKFVKISKKANKADKLTANVNLSEAKLKYIEAKNNYENAKVDLINSMYLEYQPEFKIADTKTFTYNNDYDYNSTNIEKKPFEPFVFPFKKEDAIDIAYSNSPDLQVLNSIENAMKESLKYIKRTYFPDLNVNTAYQLNNTNFATNNSFQVGVSLDSEINLMDLKHSISKANNELKIAQNEIKLFKKDLYYEIKRAFNNVEKAKNQVPLAKESVETALENLSVVEQGYIDNKLDYTALQDARNDYLKALYRYVDSIYDYNISLIQVEMAMHYHLIDIHHKSEHAVKYHAQELEEHLNKVLECDRNEINKSKKR